MIGILSPIPSRKRTFNFETIVYANHIIWFVQYAFDYSLKTTRSAWFRYCAVERRRSGLELLGEIPEEVCSKFFGFPSLLPFLFRFLACFRAFAGKFSTHCLNFLTFSLAEMEARGAYRTWNFQNCWLREILYIAQKSDRYPVVEYLCMARTDKSYESWFTGRIHLRIAVS